MESIFLLILVFLAILAAVDLFVGVSNDAVNFLNSAIGSRIASFKVIMVVASIGVLLGSTFSSGMMEIARSGVFNPEMFTFNEIIIIFFAVMITDVLLLDAFNSMGLPTSTTVSIVFELLGGAVAAALIKISTSDILLSQLGDFINSQKALAIVSGILISVVVAFVAGVVVQYITRLIFTFHYERMYRRIGGIFGGLSLTAIFYFLIMKGAKGASFMKPEYLAWINAHTLPILLVLFAGLSANKTLHQILPNSLFTALESRMQPVEQVKGAPVLPFDQVRAAINLVVSSILIASATSLKLPLSTTYVTFMVAMGSSFADGAWNRESAVYRISGVLAVISGWFLTAMCAFSACALVTWALFEGGSVVAVLFMLVAVVSLVRSNFFGKKKEESSFDIVADNTDKDSIRANIGASVDESIDTAVRLMREGLTVFQAEDEKVLNRCKNEAVNLFEDISRSRGSYYRMALRGGGDDLDNEARHIYYRIFNGMKELSHELRSVLGMSANHIANRHRPYSGALGDNLDQMLGILEDAARHFRAYAAGEGSRAELSAYADHCSSRISKIQIELLQRIDTEGLSMRSSDLYLNYLQFARAFINRFTIVALLERDLNDACRRNAARKEEETAAASAQA